MKDFNFKFDRDNEYEVKIPEPIEIFVGMQDMLSYACKRFHVDNSKELTDSMYSHACAEYMTALIKCSREFRSFVKHHCN